MIPKSVRQWFSVEHRIPIRRQSPLTRVLPVIYVRLSLIACIIRHSRTLNSRSFRNFSFPLSVRNPLTFVRTIIHVFIRAQVGTAASIYYMLLYTE